MSTTLDPSPTEVAASPARAKERPWWWWTPYAGIAVIVVYCLSPFYWMLVSSLRRTNDIFDDTPIPAPFSLENYGAAFAEDNGFLRSLLNSLIVAGITTVLTLIVGTLTAYALARLDFRGKNLVLAIVMVTSMFPGISLLVPLLELFLAIEWINTYQAMIVPSLSFALPLAVWNLTTFFRQMPTELEEAAQIDGCTPAQAFRKVILPLAAPGVFTTAIITFIAAWNEYIIALSVVNEKALKTAPVITSQFTGTAQFDTPFGTQMAAGVIVTIPLVILVLVFQRRIVAGLTAGGVK
ncbi:carbohydrate ABC transporter permease [Actinokineospora bangkokensis]|uniref:Sugar ABC transporter permease n=1 Tax=Actinokineospora bangkokensis TaxID=1193682 RepID=A0A1Q9LJG1_9PSEU|nr:carbohydrate ABC transporter permease [Actinokineospora bangkokensis]OLR92143.1 sugar ABC transporter permease [Actinokineospora bangkokensis]